MCATPEIRVTLEAGKLDITHYQQMQLSKTAAETIRPNGRTLDSDGFTFTSLRQKPPQSDYFSANQSTGTQSPRDDRRLNVVWWKIRRPLMNVINKVSMTCVAGLWVAPIPLGVWRGHRARKTDRWGWGRKEMAPSTAD